MDTMQRVAFIIAQAAACMAEITAMQAANQQHLENQPYSEADFRAKLERDYSILLYNNCIAYLRD